MIKFTEPIIVNEDSNSFYVLEEDSTELILNYSYITPHLLYINSAIDKTINIRCNTITDLNGNNLCDNILSLDFTEDQSLSNSFGEINGSIIYSGEHKIVIEVINLDTDDVIQKEISDNYFVFNQLLPGNYKIWAYENINPIGVNYFSGTLEPIKESAQFIIYNKNIYVRANWSNTISMEFK